MLNAQKLLTSRRTGVSKANLSSNILWKLCRFRVARVQNDQQFEVLSIMKLLKKNTYIPNTQIPMHLAAITSAFVRTY